MKTQPAHIHLAIHFQIVVVKRAQSINYLEIIIIFFVKWHLI